MRELMITVLFLVQGSTGLLNAKYRGCFSEKHGIEKSAVLHKYTERTLTVLKCNVYCFSNGFKYAATKNGTECHCGDLPENVDESPNLPSREDESLCCAPCVGDADIMCGGENALTLYSTGIKENVYTIMDTERWKVGCFDDSGPERILRHHKIDLIRTNTPARCMAYCKSLGYPYAGVQYKIECHCGTAVKVPTRAEGCDKPCAANPQINCGGNWRIMIYSTQAPKMTTEVELDSCYNYDKDIGLIRRTYTYMTPEKCIANCVYQGLAFAHIFKGVECMCSNKSPNKKTKATMSTCNIPCPGNLNKVCGGENQMLTYLTGCHGEASLGKLESCFKNKDGALLSGPKLNLGLENSVTYCISRCIQQGYAYAGLKEEECQCSNRIPPSTDKKMVPDYLCSMPCPKNELQNCGGGGKYMAVYRTGLPQPEGNATEDAISGIQQNNKKKDNATNEEGIGTENVIAYMQGQKDEDGYIQEEGNTTENGVVEIQNQSEEYSTTQKQEVSYAEETSDENDPNENLVSSDEKDALVFDSSFSFGNVGSSGKGFHGYIGCYKENRDIYLDAERRSSETTMSIQQCNVFCFLKGYKFSATKRGNECYCGDLPENNLPVPDDDELCDIPCLSESAYICGGVEAFSLYSTGIKELSAEEVKRQRVGCLIDRGDSRLIREHKGELITTNTPSRCIAYCKALGYPNAGLQYGFECYCGMTERNAPLLIEGCDTPCPGGANQTCGGNWRLDLYFTGTTTQTTRVQPYPGYLGCFHESRKELSLSSEHVLIGKWMSVQQCNVYCFLRAYLIAATRKGNECACGYFVGGNIPTPNDENMCNNRCHSDKSTICGGPNALTVYSTGIHVKEIGDPNMLRIGCLEDISSPRLIKEHKSKLTRTNTPSICIAYCTARGYPHAGVQYGNECFCGLLQRTPATTTGCDIPCAGNPQDKCGGHWRLDAFSTRVSESVSDSTDLRLPTDEDNNVSPNKLYAGYVGCYRDDRSDVKLTAEQRATERTMSIHQCNSYCFQKGYKFAATKKGNECSCGDLLEANIPKPDSDQLCDSPCLSDDSTRCGGKSAYTIYLTGIKEKDLGDISKLRIGCLNDTDVTRLIEEHKADLIKTNSPERCVAYCKALGYPHAGLQYGIECFCGQSHRTSPVVDGCDVPCSGNANVNCGGQWKLDIYSTGTFNMSMDINLNGCFVYNEDAAITRTTIHDMSPNKCIANCFRQGLPYANIYNGVECLCGKTVSSMKLRVSVSKCNMTCPGDEINICGGETHMLTYTTGVNGNPILGRQESCYRDENDDLLTGPKFDLGMENSIEFCISRCIESGYAFAGLRNTRECQCSHTSPNRTQMRMVPNDNCNAPCPRIELQNCGAEKFVALYRTGVIPYNEIGVGAVVQGYLGCFKDNRNGVRLTGDQATVRGLTAINCNVRCFKLGFKHAATRNGKECYCGDIEGTVPEPDDESLCNVLCTSDITKKCGGRDAYSIYSTGIKDDDIDNLEDYEIGCLRDSDDTRLIPEHKVDLTLTNGPRRCIAYCRALGYPHAGTQYSIECYCGVTRKTYPLDEGCDKTCSGEKDYLCGGDWKANVYSTGITRPPPGISPRGCFSYNKTLISTKRTIAKMEPNKCIAHCFIKGFSYAFIHNGFDCLCGPKLPTSKFRVDSRRCDIICPDDENTKCGGVDVMSSFSTGVVGDPSLGKLIGCYKDDNNDLMTGLKMNLGQVNVISLCLSRCIEQGYAYAGLRNTNECQCSQTAPKRTPVRIVPDYECASPCPMNNLENCGAPLFTALYRTGLIPVKQDDQCSSSKSRINGKNACGGQTLFSDDFKTLDTQKWDYSVKISGEDGEFVTYTKKKKNIYVQDDKLIIQPTIVKDSYVKYGVLDLKGCTGDPNSAECRASAKSYQILPPVESGQICTQKSFNFRYGVITIRAKLPRGDWVVPQIWLKPKREKYGKGYLSGKIILVTSRGNTDLVGPEGNDIGAKIVESGFQVSLEPYGDVVQKMESLTASEPWYNAFHNYSFTWTPDTLLFYVDGNVLSGLKTLYRVSDRSLLDEIGVRKEPWWNSESVITPFDDDFFICIGVSVGGMRSFPDGTVSAGNIKPWINKDIKSRLRFFLDRKQWESTWSNATQLEVDSVRITAY